MYAIKVTEEHSKNLYKNLEIIDKKILDECIKIGQKVIKVLPKISYNAKEYQ